MFITKEKLFIIKNENEQVFKVLDSAASSFLEEFKFIIVPSAQKKPCWDWNLVASASCVWKKSFTISENNRFYYDEAFFVNSSLKSSFFYKNYNRGFKIPDVIGKKPEFNLEQSTFYPQLDYQVNNITYNYLRKFAYANFKTALNTNSCRIGKFNRNVLAASFSPEKFALINFFRAIKFSRRNNLFLLNIYYDLKRKIISRYVNIKKRTKRCMRSRRRLLAYKSRYRLLSNAILRRLKKKNLPFFSKIYALKKRAYVKINSRIKIKKWIRRKRWFTALKRFYSKRLKFKRKRARKINRFLKRVNKKIVLKSVAPKVFLPSVRPVGVLIRSSKKNLRIKRRVHSFLKIKVLDK